DELGVDTVLGERRLEHAAAPFDRVDVDVPRAGAMQQRRRRQLPGRWPGAGAEVDGELLGGLGRPVSVRRNVGRTGRRRAVAASVAATASTRRLGARLLVAQVDVRAASKA